MESVRKGCNGLGEKASKRDVTLQICQKHLIEMKAELDNLANVRFVESDNKKTAHDHLWKRKNETVTPQRTYSKTLSCRATCRSSEFFENDRNHYLPLFSFYVVVVTFVCCVLFSGWIKGYL